MRSVNRASPGAAPWRAGLTFVCSDYVGWGGNVSETGQDARTRLGFAHAPFSLTDFCADRWDPATAAWDPRPAWSRRTSGAVAKAIAPNAILLHVALERDDDVR